MSDAPLMPKATAVWLVENTSLTFDQIAEFCRLHPLEVKGIADGEVATGIKGYDPISTGQLTREEIAKAEKDSHVRLHLAVSKTRTPEFKKPRGARYTPLSRRQDRPNAVLCCCATTPTQGWPDHAPRRTTKHTLQAIRERTPLEFDQSSADGPCDARPLLADRPRFRGQPRFQGSAQG